MVSRPKKEKDLSRASTGSFSKTDMWLDVLNEMTTYRVCNGRHRSGSTVPMLLTSTDVNIANQKLVVLLFESITDGRGSILTLNESGCIQAATENIAGLLSVSANSLIGRPFSSLVAEDPVLDYVRLSMEGGKCSRFGKATKNVVGSPVTVDLRGRDNAPISCTLEVLEARNNMYVVAIKASQPHTGALESIFSSIKASQGQATDNDARSLGYYTLSGVALGEGEMGEVWKGLHRPTSTDVAIKTLTRSKARELFFRSQANTHLPNTVHCAELLRKDTHCSHCTNCTHSTHCTLYVLCTCTSWPAHLSRSSPTLSHTKPGSRELLRCACGV